MKHTKNRHIALAIMFTLTAAGTQAATIVQTAANGDWNAAASWGGTAPTAENDYVLNPAVGSGGTAGLIRGGAGTANSIFLGGSLTIPTGTTLLMKTQETTTTPPPNFSQVNGVVTFDGGRLNLGPNAATSASFRATEFIITANGASFESGFSGRTLTLEGPLGGNGPITILGSGGSTRNVIFDNLVNYFGDITVTQNMGIGFGTDYVFTGDLNLSTVNSYLIVGSGQTLRFTEGNLVDFANGSVPAGTYSGAALDALGVNYTNNGGTIIVSPIPEPSTVLLGVIGLLGILRRRRN